MRFGIGDGWMVPAARYGIGHYTLERYSIGHYTLERGLITNMFGTA